MGRVLAYTGPSEGHLYPLVPTLIELKARGHRVAVRTMGGEVPRLRGLGLEAAAVAEKVTEREADDWRARTPIGALKLRVQQFADRAPAEIHDLRAAIAAEEPDVLLIDPTTWGAAIAAEASGIPFAFFAHSPLPIASKDAPPFGLGLPPANGAWGRARDRVVERVVLRPLERLAIPKLNLLRADLGLRELKSSMDFALSADRFLFYTAEPFEYPRTDWPDRVRLVGPGLWEPPTEEPAWLADVPKPLVLVTCSTEFQDDGKIVDAALAAFGGADFGVVVTTGSAGQRSATAPHNVRLERFVSHSHVLRHASCVVCHGGMGITQKALAHGVPVCVIPFGRDQPEVARRVLVADAGVRLSPRRLSGPRLLAAVQQAMTKRQGAQRIAEAFGRAGGPVAAADEIERLLGAPRAGA